MKTKLISTLKKELMIIELPEGYNLDCTYNLDDDETEIAFYLGDDCVRLKLFKGYHALLGKPDEIKEEDVKEFVDKVDLNYGKRWCAFENYIISGEHFSSALESFHSALESEIYWSNPFENPDKNKGKYTDRFGDAYLGKYEEDFKQWKKAQEKTFDRNRTLIFVKN